MFNIKKYASGECGGFKKPEGHLDDQMYPECEGKPGDRDIIKKTREKKKKKEKKSFNLNDFTKEAKFGKYLSHPDFNSQQGDIVNPSTGQIWISFRDAKYTPATPPTPEEAMKFVLWANELVGLGMDSLLSSELQGDMAITNGLKRVKQMPQKTPEEQIRKAFEYFNYFNQIEKHGWVNDSAYEKMDQKRKEKEWGNYTL